MSESQKRVLNFLVIVTLFLIGMVFHEQILGIAK